MAEQKVQPGRTPDQGISAGHPADEEMLAGRMPDDEFSACRMADEQISSGGMADQEIYAGRVVTLRLKRLPQPDGSTHLREIVEHAEGAAVVAVERDGHVLLVRQLRPAVGAHVLELPAGLVDPGEQPIDTARRELEEETGCTAQRLEPLVQFFSSPGYSTELLHIFVATGLAAGQVHPDEEEAIELVRLPLRQAIDQVLHAEISDAKTVTGLLAYWRRTLTSL